ncbi:MAG: hypothetical protein ACK4RG_02115 [Fimbriimonadales bacterium]
MSELMVLLQALLLIAGWLLFLRAQTELRAQAVRQSLTGELEELRQTVDALLQRLAEQAAQAEARIEAKWRELELRSANRPPHATPSHGQTHPHNPQLDRGNQTAASETFTPNSGYNLSASDTSPYGAVAILAEQGLSIPEIARRTGYAPGEVELILSLTRRTTEENR